MQPLHAERERAIVLRQKGLSYSEIQKVLAVSQSSLSAWLRDIVLTPDQKQRLDMLSVIGQKEGGQIRKNQRLNGVLELQKEVVEKLPFLIKDSSFTFGLALYWAEGSKQKEWDVSARAAFSNSEARLILLMRLWFIKFFHAKEEDFEYTLFIHTTVDNIKSLQEWSKILEVVPARISIVLKHNKIRGRRKQANYKGLIRLTVKKSARLNRLIALYQEAVGKELLQ